MTITTTSGKRFTQQEHGALAALIHKRFGDDDAAFCVAWRRLMQNTAEDSEILKLLPPSNGREARYLKDDLMREGVIETRDFQAGLLDTKSCQILRRHLQRLRDKADQKARSLVRKQPWKYL
jgi:hypothetical protein